MWLNFVKVDLFAIYIFLILCFIIFIYRKATLLKSQEIDIHERYIGKALMSVDGSHKDQFQDAWSQEEAS